MEKNNNKIIYLPDGRRLHFFHSPDDGICVSEYDSTNALLADAYSDFDVCALDGKIYLSCQNYDGDLIFLKYSNSKWRKYTLLVSKNKMAYDKHFCLVPTWSCVQLFYTVRSGERLLLAQQILDEAASPIVIAQISDSKSPFCTVTDSEGNAYIYYQNEQKQLGYKIFKWSSKTTSEFVNIKDISASSIHACADKGGNHHICVVSGEQIIYMQRNISSQMGKAIDIARIEPPDKNIPYIHIGDSGIYVVWCLGCMVMYSKSTDGGMTFSSPVRLVSSGNLPTLFSLQKEASRALSLGYFLNGEARFFRIDNSEASAFTRSAHTSVDKSELERLKNAVAKIGSEVSEIKTRLELLEDFLRDKM